MDFSGLFYTPHLVEDFATYLIQEELEDFEDWLEDNKLYYWLESKIYDFDKYLFHKDNTNDMALIKYVAENDYGCGYMDYVIECMNDSDMSIQLTRSKLRIIAFEILVKELQQEIEEKFNELKKEKHTCDKCNHFEKDIDDIHYPENWTKKYPMGYKLCSDCVNEDEEK